MVTTADETDGVETVENATKPNQESESTRRVRVLGRSCRRNKFGDVAIVQNTAGTSGIE
jgi:hypothetical protein